MQRRAVKSAVRGYHIGRARVVVRAAEESTIGIHVEAPWDRSPFSCGVVDRCRGFLAQETDLSVVVALGRSLQQQPPSARVNFLFFSFVPSRQFSFEPLMVEPHRRHVKGCAPPVWFTCWSLDPVMLQRNQGYKNIHPRGRGRLLDAPLPPRVQRRLAHLLHACSLPESLRCNIFLILFVF